MEYFYENDLLQYEGYTNEELKRLWKENNDEKARIVLAKRNHSIKGDVFIHEGFIINLKTYLEQNPTSTATTIEEAGAEYLVMLEQQEV